MAESRSVKIIFPGSNAPKEIQSSAKLWGDLKKELMDQLSVTFDNQKVHDFETSVHFEKADAQLPEGDLRLLVSTDKNKSGMNVTKSNYHKAPFTELRTFCKKITGFAPNGKQACLDALDKHYGNTSKAKSNSEKIAKATKETVKKAKKGKKAVNVSSVKDTPKKDKSDSYKALEERIEVIEKYLGLGSGDEDYLAAGRNLK